METDPLKGDRKGFSILTVTGHWRLTFRYDEATGRGLSPNRPQTVWRVWRGGRAADSARRECYTAGQLLLRQLL